MGKSFANFMCKKFFHPSSFANIKRVWLAEQRLKEETKKQDDLRSEYERDQDHYNNRQLMGDERVKHGLTFIYEAPKAYQHEAEKNIDGKLEWKRPTPAEDSTPSGSSQDDAGVVVRNVRCVRCNQMGHIPTDRECPLYKSSEEDKPSSGAINQDQLVEEMRRDGYAFKQSVLGRCIDDANFGKDLVRDDDSDDGPPAEEAFLNSLTKKQKKKLLKKINRMEKKYSGSVHKKTSHKKRRQEESSSSEEESKKRHKTHRKQRKVQQSHSDSTSSDDSSDERHRRTEKGRHVQKISSRERDAHIRASKRRQDSSSDDGVMARGAKMRDNNDSHHRNTHRGHGPIKRERRSDDEDSGRSQKGQRPRDDHQPTRSKHGDRSYYRDRDSRELDVPRIKVEKTSEDGRRDRDGERSLDRRDNSKDRK